ncbi:26S proteasome non-ATPase regulatory subunit 4 [Tanacetum coccineum]
MNGLRLMLDALTDAGVKTINICGATIAELTFIGPKLRRLLMRIHAMLFFSSFKEAMKMGVEVYHNLKFVIKKKYEQDATNVGDEENRVGILAMGDEVYKFVEPTRDLQKIMSSIHGARVDNDSMSILDVLEMADEFLGNNIMYKRIVVFAGGLVYWFKHQLRGIGTNLKEKGVAVDVINFGDKDGPRAGRRDVSKDNRIPRESKKGSLEALVTAANHNDNSHILHVLKDQFSLRDHLSRFLI